MPAIRWHCPGYFPLLKIQNLRLGMLKSRLLPIAHGETHEQFLMLSGYKSFVPSLLATIHHETSAIQGKRIRFHRF